MDLSSITVIIPAFNEELGIRATLNDLKLKCPEAKIIVVDDGSTDATEAVASAVPGVLVLSHGQNRGYGAALKTGMMHSRTEYVLWFDADGQHQATDIQNIVAPVMAGKRDAVFGARGKDSAFVVKRIPGKWVLRMVSLLVARRSIPDLNCGLRCFRRDVILRYLHLLPDGFSASATSTLIMIKRGYRIEFCPIQAKQRLGKSTVKMFRDGFNTLRLIFRIMMLFDAFLFFSFLAMIQLLPGIIYTLVMGFTTGRGVPVLGALTIISGLLTFFMGLLSAQISEIRQERFEFRAMDK